MNPLLVPGAMVRHPARPDWGVGHVQSVIGERVTVIPNHACTTTNMHDEVYGVRQGKVEVVWPVLARGKVR